MAALYRKYRPQNFAEIVGQKHIIQTLQNATKSGVLSHAYLFTGSRGVGKTTIARILAKAANCTSLKDGEVCKRCPNCLAIEQGNFLDLVEIDAASNTGVENVRELIEHVKFKPSQGKTKVFIIDEVHMLSKSAFNALLKTLEEPPAHVMFILATTESGKVPATIISRTQRFDFSRITPADILLQLQKIVSEEKLTVSESVLQLIARHSDGSMRDALSLLDKIGSLGQATTLAETEKLLGITNEKSSVDLMSTLVNGNVSELPAFFDGLLFSGVDFFLFNKDFLEYCRKLLVLKVTGSADSLGLDSDEEKNIILQAEKLSIADVIYIIRLFLRSFKDLTYASSPELPMLLAGIEGSLKFQTSGAESPMLSPRPLTAQKTSETKVVNPDSIVSKKSVSETVEETPANYDSVTLSEVEKFWPHVLEAVKHQNSPLATLLRNSPVEGVDISTIIIGVKFLFHKEHLEGKKNRALIIEAIGKASGKNLGIKIILSEKRDIIKESATLDALSDALRVFGGELVE